MFHIFYSVFRFLFEILCIAIAGYWGFGRVTLGKWRYLLAVLAPLAIILVWSVWGAPKAANRLQGYPLLALELGVYAIDTMLLYNTNLKQFTAVFAVFAVLNACANYLM